MGKDEEVTLNQLIQVHQQVKEPGPLVKLPADFYKQVRDFVDRLEKAYDTEHTKDSSSMKTLQLADQLKKARDLRMAILRERTRKLLLLAHQSVVGSMVETKNITPEEKELFEAVQSALHNGRVRIIEGGVALPDPQQPEAVAVPTEAIAEAPEIERREDTSTPHAKAPVITEERPKVAPVAIPSSPDSDELVSIRVMEDVPGIAVGAGECDLKKKDVIAVSKNIAVALQSHGKAKSVQ
jgi:DNA replication initiation complex subunit (GINS family)